MQNVWGKAAAVLIGVLLLLIGIAMLTAESGMAQTGRNNALAYVIGLVGLGLIAASFFGDSLKYDGDHKGPLGKIIATGGAAVFVIGLVFILATEDRPPRSDAPDPAAISPPTSDPGAVATASGTLPPATAPSPAAPSPAAPQQPQPQQASTAVPAQIAQQMAQSRAPQGMQMAWTYCSLCCPQGPDGCPHTSYGIAGDAAQAATTAIYYCTASGGTEQSCRDNVAFVSAADLGL